jgi:MFS family permease
MRPINTRKRDKTGTAFSSVSLDRKQGRCRQLAKTAGRKRFSVDFPFEAFTRDIWIICISNVVGAFGEGLYFWVFPLYVRSLQADYIQLAIVTSALMGFAALVPIPGGLLADRLDRKKIIILSWTPWIFAPLIYSFAQDWTQLIPGTICWGVSMLGLPAITAYVISNVGDEKKVTSVLSFVWASYSFSYIFAPAVGTYLATIIGMRPVLQISALFAAVSTCIFFLLRSQHPRKIESNGKPQNGPPVEQRKLWNKMLVWAGLFAAASFFMGIARPYITPFLAEQAKFSEFQVGVFGSVSYAGVTLMGVALGRLGDKWKRSGAIGFCLLFYVVAVVPLLFLHDVVSLMPVAFLFGGSTVSGSIVSSMVGTIAPRSKRGLWVSIPQALGMVAAFVAPYVGGYLYTLSPLYAFLVSVSGIPLIALIAFTKLKD